jgi:hypothetical protein
MNYKPFIKLGNKSFNIQMISYLNLDDTEKTVTLVINMENIKHQFESEETYKRFKSYIKLFSTDFGEGELQETEQNKSLLTD